MNWKELDELLEHSLLNTNGFDIESNFSHSGKRSVLTKSEILKWNKSIKKNNRKKESNIYGKWRIEKNIWNWSEKKST